MLNANETHANIDGLWKKVLGILQTELNPMMYNTWVVKATPQNLTDKEIDLIVELDYAKKQLQKYLSLIEDAFSRVHKEKLKVNILVGTKKEVLELDDEKDTLGPLFEPAKATLSLPSTEKIRASGLSPKFRFDNFIIGNSNQLAFAIAQAIAEKPGESYNPFFLYSGVGLGKTHLMQAIGNKIMENYPKLNVVYTTGEAFMNELIEAIQSGNRGKYASNEFRNKFRKTDVLLIDDVQFIIGREATQLEFFHTFNTLYMAGKQIILTSDRPPKDFTNLEKRITSRFGSGIIADIQNPDADLRTAILRTKRDYNKDDIPNDVIDFIAKNVESNIRELEGAYLQVLTTVRTSGRKATIETAEQILGKNIHVGRKQLVTPMQILKAVGKYYSIRIPDLKGKRRTKEIVIPRQVAMYLIRELTDAPLINIGEHLGGRDHTTIMHGIKRVEDEMQEMGKVRQDVVNVRQLI